MIQSEAGVAAKRITGNVLKLLEEKEFPVVSIVLFGSALDLEGFDARGGGTSDIDLLAVVEEVPDQWKDRMSEDILPGFTSCSLNAPAHALFTNTQGRGLPWDEQRSVHLLMVTQTFVENVHRTKGTNQDLFTAYSIAILNGIEIFKR